jgi:hypothetical protein
VGAAEGEAAEGCHRVAGDSRQGRNVGSIDLGKGRSSRSKVEEKALVIVCLEEKTINDGHIRLWLELWLTTAPYPAFQTRLGNWMYKNGN